MFFGYPIAATADNWLHDSLQVMVAVIHASHNDGLDQPTWPAIIPVGCRALLRRRTGLRDRLEAYSLAVGNLSLAERAQVFNCLVQENNISDLLACTSECDILSDLPEAIRNPVRILFEYAFDLLAGLGVRDNHYNAIYQAVPQHVCPFCGMEYFDALGAPREDLDHYLPKHLYPFAAANLRNLVPMGVRCNQRYKIGQDILRDNVGVRRRGFDPYMPRAIKVTLQASVPFGGVDGQKPEWVVDFEPNPIECNTWDEVFDVKARIKRDVLDPSFFKWLGDFAKWFKLRIGLFNQDESQLVTALQTYVQEIEAMSMSAREFLRVPVFQMLHTRCVAGDGRLLALVRDVVEMAIP